MKHLAAFALALCLAFTCCGCAQPKQEQIQILAMDTVMTFTAYGRSREDAVLDAVGEVRRLERLLSRTDEKSPVYRLNQQGTAEVDGEVWDLIRTAADYTAATGGAFDITVAPVVSAWGFTTDSYQVPEQETLSRLLDRVGTEHIREEAAGDGQVRLTLDAGTGMDLGGIGKGYASDRVVEVFQKAGVTQGWAALGGNVAALGRRSDGKPWQVGVRDPARPEDAAACLGMLSLEDAFAVTSGSYERFFEQDGTRYHHIIDPATGYPAQSGLVSVTVVAPLKAGGGTMCDALSTALFVMGEERAAEFWRQGPYEFEMVLVTEDGRVLVTDGLADRFALEGDGYVLKTLS